MNKAELIERVARDTGLSKAGALRVLDAVLDNVTKSLRKGEKVTLVGFGTFQAARRRARTGRNPRTGIPIRIDARRVPKFVPGKELRDEVGG
jgi:DNA-binding protein HU-beta